MTDKFDTITVNLDCGETWDIDNTMISSLGTITLGPPDYIDTGLTPDYINSGLTIDINDTYQSGIFVNDDADIMLGDRSLKEFMKKVEERLAILQVNSALESEWDELKQLGDQYRELEKQLLEKTNAWNILKGQKK